MHRAAINEPTVLLALVTLSLLFSAIDPVADRLTWFLETAPVMLGLLVVIRTRLAFPLTPLLYRLLTLHAIILIIGGYYTYAEVPPV